MSGITLRTLCLTAFMTALLAAFGPMPGICEDVDQSTELAKKLANPVASLISVPLQFNYDENYGLSDDGEKFYINVQPVIPFALSEDWNLISRTILPLVHLNDMPPGNDETGLGDITQSLFFSPSQPTNRGIIWGVGPVFLLPTATDELLGSEKWGAGPTAVVLKQTGPWTVGFLGNHVWSFAGEDDRTDINASYMQPFLAYVTKTHTTFNLNTESVYDWEAEQWSVPINFQVSQLLKIGGQPISVGAGVRYWAESPDAGPEDWGARLSLTFLFPK